jgi:hypothetical protein
VACERVFNYLSNQRAKVDVTVQVQVIYKARNCRALFDWSEFGRQLLSNYVDQYEAEHGEMAGGEDVELPLGAAWGSSAVRWRWLARPRPLAA